jgi:AcrR family transcriptional regulator
MSAPKAMATTSLSSADPAGADLPHEELGPGWFSRRARSANKRVRTRARILETAISVFSERGVERASVAEIAGRASLSNASFYYHFKNKEELITAVAGALSTVLIDEIDRRMMPVSHGPMRIALGTQLLIHLASSDREWASLYILAFDDLREFKREIEKGLARAVQLGHEQGSFDTGYDPQLAASLLAIVRVAIRAKLERPDDWSVEEVGARMTLRILGIPAAASIDLAAEANQRLRAMFEGVAGQRAG